MLEFSSRGDSWIIPLIRSISSTDRLKGFMLILSSFHSTLGRHPLHHSSPSHLLPSPNWPNSRIAFHSIITITTLLSRASFHLASFVFLRIPVRLSILVSLSILWFSFRLVLLRFRLHAFVAVHNLSFPSTPFRPSILRRPTIRLASRLTLLLSHHIIPLLIDGARASMLGTQLPGGVSYFSLSWLSIPVV